MVWQESARDSERTVGGRMGVGGCMSRRLLPWSPINAVGFLLTTVSSLRTILAVARPRTAHRALQRRALHKPLRPSPPFAGFAAHPTR